MLSFPHTGPVSLSGVRIGQECGDEGDHEGLAVGHGGRSANATLPDPVQGSYEIIPSVTLVTFSEVWLSTFFTLIYLFFAVYTAIFIYILTIYLFQILFYDKKIDFVFNCIYCAKIRR